MHRKRQEPVLREQPRLARHGPLAEIRRLVPRGHGEPLVERQREASELARGGPHERELAEDAEVAERLAGNRDVAQHARRIGRGRIAGLVKQERQIQAHLGTLGDSQARGEIRRELVLDHTEGELARRIPERHRPVRVRQPNRRSPVERPR
jgi:hypothetical protein